MLDWLDLDTVIRLGTSFWVQAGLILGLTSVILFFGKIVAWIDALLAVTLTGWFDPWERVRSAPVDVKWDEFVLPDPNIPIDRQKHGNITPLAPIENWLTQYPLDYSFFYDYPIDPQEMRGALSRLLAKLPILGGRFCKYNESTVGVDHTNPRIQFIYGTSNKKPSVDYRDFRKPHYYSRYTTGVSHIFPYPEGKPVFKMSVIHFRENEEDEYSTLLAIGCTHSLTDGEGFFTLMRCLAAELRGEEYEIPICSRAQYVLQPHEVRTFKPHAMLLNKHFQNCILPTHWSINANWPVRRWTVRSWDFTPADIKAWKAVALNGRAGEKLKSMRLSTNDVITALFWKLRATLNRDYPFDHPTICSVVINTRKWLPERFPQDRQYMGNALAFVLLAKTRRELIDSDFSEVCYMVRSMVASLRREQFEEDMSLYSHLAHEGIDQLHRYHGRWWVDPREFGHRGRWIMDRDMMISNLVKLDTHTCDFGLGDPTHIRFNHNEEGSTLTYLFKKDQTSGVMEFYTALAENDMEFYDTHDVTKANEIDWDEINRNHARETTRWIRRWPKGRRPIRDWGALFSNDKTRKFWRW